MTQLVLIDLDDLDADCMCTELDEDGDEQPCSCGCCQYLDRLALEQRELLWREELAELAACAGAGFIEQADQVFSMSGGGSAVVALDVAAQRVLKASRGHMQTNQWLRRQAGYTR